MQVVEIKLRSGLLLLGPPGGFPIDMVRSGDGLGLQLALAGLRRDTNAIEQLRRAWPRLSHDSRSLPDHELSHALESALNRHILTAVLLPIRVHGLRNAVVAESPPDRGLPPAIASLGQGEKILRALRLSLRHLPHELIKAVETIVIAEAGLWVAGLIAIAAAQLWPPAGAAIDGLILGVLWLAIGWAAWSALKSLAQATMIAMNATTERELDQAGSLYASFFMLIGVAGLGAIRTKLVEAKAGGAGEPAAPAQQVAGKAQPNHDAPKPEPKQAPRPLPALKPAPVDRIVYRGDGRSPSTVFDEGFQPRGTATDLESYVDTNTESAFVGTSKFQEVATVFAQKNSGYVYKIDGSLLKGIDVNEAYPANPYRHEAEIAILGGIPKNAIISAQRTDSYGSMGPILLNPNYTGK